MKIKKDYTKNDDNHTINDINDITSMINKFKEKYRNVFVYNIGEVIFFYRTLSRKEHKIIIENKDINDFEKEEVICETCVLYPIDFDFEQCDAGIPGKLCPLILKNSFLDSIDSRIFITKFYREEMFDTQNQIPCIINEAFPQFDIEDIEDWDMEKTAKYLSRAEWKLVNLRGATITDPSLYETENNKTNSQENKEEKKVTLKGTDKEKMSPEKLREMQQKFPEIDWSNDSLLNEGIDSLKQEFDTSSPALRPGF